MATLYTQQNKNVNKTWLLMGAMLVLIVAIGFFLSQYYSDPGILYVAIIFSLLLNFASYWWSAKIVLGLYRARPASIETEHNLINIVENLAITAGLPIPKIYVIPDPAPNAFATGRNAKNAVVAVTSGLLVMLNKTELEGVIAHEMSHIGNRDILLNTVVVVLVGSLAILSDIFLRSTFFGSRSNNDKGGGIIMIIGLILMILSPIIAQMIQLAISRKREFLADASGALLTRYPEGLAGALQKISSFPGQMKMANNATAHLFISSPFGKAGNKISNLFMTHPPVEARIKALLGDREYEK
ncbi:MAG: M48 family metallopeptidase [Minisyncoccia bacterium]